VSNLLNRCLNIADLNHRAQKKLPSPIYGYLERGSDDEYSLDNNTDAFDRYQLQPQSLTDVSRIDTRTNLVLSIRHRHPYRRFSTWRLETDKPHDR